MQTEIERQIERRTIVTCRWWRDSENEIKPDHIPALEEQAEEHIFMMTKHGFTSGELNDEILMSDDDPEDGVAYFGMVGGNDPAR